MSYSPSDGTKNFLKRKDIRASFLRRRICEAKAVDSTCPKTEIIFRIIKDAFVYLLCLRKCLKKLYYRLYYQGWEVAGQEGQKNHAEHFYKP
jgi:hypothetical protein